ncbi:MAG: porin, partial [Oxalobacteraceae bacterium]|nr:porin [Oxalobacteraceae bacterium]
GASLDVRSSETIASLSGGGNTGGFFTRNAVTYSTPDLGGASLSVQKQIQGNDAASFDGTAASGSASLGDVKASFGYLDRTDRKSWTVGALAPLGPVTASLRYTESDPTGATKASTQIRGGVSYALTDSTTLTVQHAAYSGASAGWNLSAYGAAAASATKGGSAFAVGIATNF